MNMLDRKHLHLSRVSFSQTADAQCQVYVAFSNIFLLFKLTTYTFTMLLLESPTVSLKSCRILLVQPSCFYWIWQLILWEVLLSFYWGSFCLDQQGLGLGAQTRGGDARISVLHVHVPSYVNAELYPE